MARDHSKYSLDLKNKVSSKPSQFIIYVEGRNTEDSYLKHLKNSSCTIVPVVERGKGIGSCVEFVETCEAKFNRLPSNKRRSFKEKWLMFDDDGHADFRKAIKLARDKGFKVAFSSMCIEYWFLLHFENHSGKPIPLVGNSHSRAQINCINRHIQRINKTLKTPVAEYDCNSKCVNDDFYDLMLAINKDTGNRRIVDAVIRAKAMHERKVADGAETQESVTTIYELLIALGAIKVIEDEDGTRYELNLK